MKLLQETSYNLKLDHAEDGRKIFFEGIFIQLDTVNRNNRLYPSEAIAPIIDKYIQEQVAMGKAVGEADHPTNPNLNIDRISHKIVDLRRDGSNYIGRALILDTPMGKVLKGLTEGGVTFGVSTRGVGKVNVNEGGIEEVSTPFILVTAGDAVMSPSAPDAYVQAVMENREWVINSEGKWVQNVIEQTKAAIHRAPTAAIPKITFEAYRRFLDSIGKK